MLAWLATHEPISLAPTRWALQPKDSLRMRLTRQVHAEPSDASATLLYSLTEDWWDADVLAALGVYRTDIGFVIRWAPVPTVLHGPRLRKHTRA